MRLLLGIVSVLFLAAMAASIQFVTEPAKTGELNLERTELAGRHDARRRLLQVPKICCDYLPSPPFPQGLCSKCC